MTNHQSAVDYYHDLCHEGNLAEETWAFMAPEMRTRQLYFGDRPLCTVLRPLFHTEADYRYLSQRTEAMLRVFRKASNAMLGDPALLAQIHLTPDEEELVHLPTGYSTNIPTARLDSFFTRHVNGAYTLNYIEFNGESPASMGYSDVLGDLFTETPLMRRFHERYNTHYVQARPHAVEALLNIYAQWRGNTSDRPHMAIVDLAGVPTAPEFEILADYFRRFDITCVICTPDDLEWDGKTLYASGEPVDFIYKRILTTELLQRYGIDHPMIHALRAGAVCLANPFTCKILHKKASFAFVSDERNDFLFTPEEREVIRQHIPWTRNLSERTTIGPDGDRIDLMPWASDNRDQLVLKPNDEYGGKGVLIGWETDQTTWDEALAHARNDPSIIQTRALISYEDFPSLGDNGAVLMGKRLVDCDPFLFHGDTVGGTLVRLSSVTLLNVTAGGGSVVPMFIIAEK